ncbi:hypothetical protein [Ammoniphilus sp. 3BR4]|uniref:hypothetical protein n=1 Tax=Ammoniphilus sp. 3BR4 TaxID=3158265 RepID=UPI0034650682
MNKQTRQEVDKEAKKIVQEEMSREIGVIRSQLNEIIDSLHQQTSNTFNPNDLIQQIQQLFEESQHQLRVMNQQLTDFIQKATPLLNHSVQQYKTNPNISQQNTSMSQFYSQHGNGQMQQTKSQKNQMSHPIPQQGYGQNQFSAQSQFSQNIHPARINPTFNNISGQRIMNPNGQTLPASFNQLNSYGTLTPDYYGIGQTNNQYQTTQNFQNRNF